MGKRKRNHGAEVSGVTRSLQKPMIVPEAGAASKTRKNHRFENDTQEQPFTIQIIVGTYEKVLHGLTATVSGLQSEDPSGPTQVEHTDTFMFNAHSSSIRCLALSPEARNSARVILASGGADQAVNLFSISTVPPSGSKAEGPRIPTLAGSKIIENSMNRELGSLQHHAGNVNALYFPTRSKLLSAAEDNTIAVARTRDWTVLTTIKAPIPKARGRPSGAPTGVNDLAVHPSMKLMLSVGKGEKCMRLWNLVTGKKAGVLNFERDLLQNVGEGRYSSGEGRRVEWNSLGEEFAVAFESGCAVYGIDSKPKCCILPSPRTKVHQMHYVTLVDDDEEARETLAVSTEDGRILFYFTDFLETESNTKLDNGSCIRVCAPSGVLGGPAEGLVGRIKDFEILPVPQSKDLVVVTGSSDGAIRTWFIDAVELAFDVTRPGGTSALVNGHGHGDEPPAAEPSQRQIGRLLSTYEAGNRITCLKAFVMSAHATSEPVDNGEASRQTNGGEGRPIMAEYESQN